MTEKSTEPRGVPPTRPFPSQIMHLLELTRLDIDAAAQVVHLSADNIGNWMTFNAANTMPPAQWLLLNTYTLAVKNVCWPAGNEDYIRARFPNAFPEEIKGRRKVVIPNSPSIPPVDDIIDLLHDANASLEELTFVPTNTVNTWLGPDKRFMPYAVYELAVMTLWARGSYTPTVEMAEYIDKKYYGVFNPGR